MIKNFTWAPAIVVCAVAVVALSSPVGTAPLYAAYTTNDAGGNQGYGATGTSVEITSTVPEPTPLLLLASGLLIAAAVLAHRRRRLTAE
jgi:hypothetical protein